MEEEEAAAPDLPYKLLLACPSGLSPSQVSVIFAESYDRKPHPDHSLEISIAEIWNQRLQKNASLFNGTKFRYDGCTSSHYEGGPKNEESHVWLHLGMTDYRTFVGTNLSPLWKKFIILSEDDSFRCQHMSSPLGNGAVVETSDKKILLLQRSHNVGEFPGHFVFPGGHPEPQEVKSETQQYDMKGADSESYSRKISEEMFDSIIREVVEEIGVPATSLSTPVFIGVSRRELNVRPAAFFFIRCSLHSKEIQQHYSSAQDSYESTELYTVSMSELDKMTSKMPGCHQGGFALYKLMMDAKKANYGNPIP